MCKSEDFASSFPLPGRGYTTAVPDPDLEHLFRINEILSNCHNPRHLFSNPEYSPSHLQWISNILLHHSWARTEPNDMYILIEAKHTTPLNAILNFLLMWCNFLGSPVEEEVLRIQDKSYDISYFRFSSCSLIFTSDRTEPIMDRLSKAVLSVVNGTSVQRVFILDILRNLIKLKTRPACLTKVAYEWCSAICENRKSLED